MEYWDGLLLVNQTEEVHGEVHAFLNQLLNDGRTPAAAEPAWRAELVARLQARTDVEFDDAELGEVCAWLREAHGISVLVAEDYSETPVDLELRDVPLATVLAWVSERAELDVRLADGAVLLGEEVDTRIRMYDVSDLIAVDEDPDYARGQLEDLIRQNVEPATWDNYPQCGIHSWKDLMIVVHTDGAHLALSLIHI